MRPRLDCSSSPNRPLTSYKSWRKDFQLNICFVVEEFGEALEPEKIVKSPQFVSELGSLKINSTLDCGSEINILNFKVWQK